MPAPTTGKPGTMNGPPPGYHPAPPYGGGPSHYQQPPYGGPPPPGGYMGWQGQQHPPYGGPGSGWNPGPSPPPMGMYRQGAHPPSNMERNNWNGYRGGPPPPPNSQGRRPQPGETSPSRKKSTSQDGHYWGQQWPQHQWSGGHPPSQNWQQPGPPPLQQPGSAPSVPQHLRGSPPNMWTGMSHDSTNPERHIRRSPESISGDGMTGYPPSRMNRMDPLCQPIGSNLDGVDDMYMSRLDKKTRAEIERDKGRGNYRCGRCGAPKKGHICPYQPKLKRRPDEPPPVMRSAAIQVEMDEFMTLRRLNLEIQGFPESYAESPLMLENKVVGQPHPLAFTAGVVTNMITGETVSGLESTSCAPDMPRSSPSPTRISENVVCASDEI